MKTFVRYWIPLGTLVVVALAAFVARMSADPVERVVIAPPPAAALAPLELPARDRSVAGRIVSRAGPVADALVWLRSGVEPAWTYTDAEGGFRIDGLARGPWPACVVARGFEPARLSVPDTGAYQTLEIGAPLPPPPALAKIERTSLDGRIVGSIARELESHAVLLTPSLPLETIGAPVPRIAETTADGSFRFEDLAHGEYRIEVVPPWARGGSWPDLLRGAGGSVRTFLHDARPQVLDLVLESGEIAGKLTGTDGNALEGALVLVTLAEDTNRVWPPISTASDGSFLAADLPAGSYTVVVRAGAATAQQTVTVVARERREVMFAALKVEQ